MQLQDTNCVFCGREEESHKHLFFECKIIAAVWERIIELCLIYRIPQSWDEKMQWLKRHFTQKIFIGNKKRLTFAISVYYIWKFRNQIVHGSTITSEMIIVRKVVKEMRLVVLS